MDELCVVCEHPLADQPVVKLGKKGSESLNRASISRGNNIKTEYGQRIHKQCRRDYIHNRNVLSKTVDSNENCNNPVLRSIENFDFKSNCLFCAKNAKISDKKRGADVFPVRTFGFQDLIKTKCAERNDDWSESVAGRLSSVIDLPAAEARYHQTCNVNFRTGRQLPKAYRSVSLQSPGRPEKASGAFLQYAMEYIKDNASGEVLSVADVVNIMGQQCGDSVMYSVKHMKRKIQDHFGDLITFNSLEGKKDIITLRETSATIIHEFAKSNTNKTDETEKERIIKAAAKLIKADINACESNKQVYPSCDIVSSREENLKFIPESLQFFLKTLFDSKDSIIKVGSIGQAVMQATRPRGLIAPLQIGLGVQMHRQFGSHFLVDTLHKLGFCSSYCEIQRFEMNCAETINCTIPTFFPGKFLQFVSDNVDHNIGTLDGNDTYHGMGTIAVVTPGTKVNIPVPRREITIEEVADLGRITVHYFTHKEHEPLIFHKLPVQSDGNQQFDTLCKVLWPVVPYKPVWSGFMQLYDRPSDAHYPGVSAISFLPMIDLNPSDLNCIFTTMNFVKDLSQKYNVNPVLTFDQPLFAKATYIAQCEPITMKDIILRLGAFHTQMSFLGSIGHLMAGSGLSELLETVYAPNAVTHMMSGKAIARAVRGHFLVDTALHALLMKRIYGIEHYLLKDMDGEHDLMEPQDISQHVNEVINETDMKIVVVEQEVGPRECVTETKANIRECIEHITMDGNSGTRTENSKGRNVFANLTKTYQDLQQGLINSKEINNEPRLTAIFKDIQDTKSKVTKQNRTGRLWVQYTEMVCILQDFIRAERTGNWLLHLSSLQRMLPYFAASGHNLYLKSAYIYLQNMRELSNKHPDVHKNFLEGNHVTRRVDRYWGGLSTDLTIEQVLMRSLKTSGGLTRGRGMTEKQCSLWLLSMPATSEMNAAMQTYTATNFETSEQHKEERKARIARDEKDTLSVIDFLTSHDPFDESHACDGIRNIETGVTGSPKVNVDNAVLIGTQILTDMVGQTMTNYSFKRSKQAITLAQSPTGPEKEIALSIDPQVLFQRLTAVARYADELPEVLKYELTTVPSSLFDNTGLLREPQKSVLADSIWKLGNCGTEEIAFDNCVHIIDGGSLLQKIVWQKGTFSEICELYNLYLSRRYKCAVVVFDGYASGPSTKDVAHKRRALKGGIGSKVVFDFSTPFKGKKETFLRNKENKQHFLELLGAYLSEHEIRVCYANSDADVLIVQTALEYAKSSSVTVVGEDTDLLVLLCYHTDIQGNTIIFKSDSTKHSNRRVWDINRTKLALGEDVCSLLPFVHALSGCDTTSRLFGVGKAAVLKLLRSNNSFKQIALQFMTAVSEEDILKHGEMCIVKLYDTSWNMSLDNLRFQKFASKVVTATSSVQVHVLPPTSDAASYHIRRVYLQTQMWIGNETLNPCDWGWELQHDQLIPIKTKKPPAPEELLKVIRCNCKVNCDTRRCSCRKHGLECSVGCGDCRGISCTNSYVLQELKDEDNVDDDGVDY